MAVKPITDTLRLLAGGMFLDDCSQALAQVVKAVDETGKPGKLTITLDLKRTGGAIAIVPKVSTKTPEEKPSEDLLWATVEGNLSLDNPNQRSLEFKDVPNARAELRSI